jgi:hypothetical protein
MTAVMLHNVTGTAVMITARTAIRRSTGPND